MPLIECASKGKDVVKWRTRTSFDPIIPHLADLLGHQADHKNNDGTVKQQGRHVGEPALGEEGVGVVAEAGHKEPHADRQEHPERREQRGDLGDDEEEPGAVLEQFDFAPAHPRLGLDGDVFDRAAAAQVAERQGGRVGKGVGQQVDELPRHGKPHQPETRGQVLDLEPGDVGGEPVVHPVGKVAVGAGLRLPGARADHHVVAVLVLEQPGDVLRLVLAVGVHHEHPLPPGAAQPGLDGRAVADVVGMRPDVGAGLHGLAHGVVGGAVVHHQDLEIRVQGPNRTDRLADDACLVVGRQENGHLASFVLLHGRPPCANRGKNF